MHLPDPHTQPQFYDAVPSKRLVAWIIDMVLIILMCLVIVPLTAFAGLFFFPLLMVLVGFVYRVVTLANGSATWGMRFVAIELRTADGTRFNTAMALLHTAGYTLSLAFPILQVISVIMMLTSARGQGLSDQALGTVALNRRALA